MPVIVTFQDLVNSYTLNPGLWQNQFQNALNSYGNTHGITFAQEATINSIVVASISNNSFPVGNKPYILVDQVIVYTGETIRSLTAGAALPASKYVSWAPLGAQAGTLLTNIGRKEYIYGAKPAVRYIFNAVRLVNGPTTEGVGGSPADIDPYETGWICTWAAQGTPAVL